MSLSGMGGRSVHRVEGGRGAVVVKAGAAAREAFFYRHLAPRLPDTVRVPACEVYDGAGGPYLLLEELAALPPDRWAGPEVYDVLVALHGVPGPVELPDPFVPRWSADLAAGVVTDPAVARVLELVRTETQPWLAGDTLVSGDPNPRNWTVRPDGGPVLLDWERVGLATGAVDLAIAVPGLPGPEEAARAATGYREAASRAGQEPGIPVDEMGRAVLLVKTWTAVELLAQESPHADDVLSRTQRWLAAELPAWLRSWH